jgi:hypothetical protein
MAMSLNRLFLFEAETGAMKSRQNYGAFSIPGPALAAVFAAFLY